MLRITELTKADLAVAESINGNFYYHLRRRHDMVGLCADRVMPTSIRIDAWGTRSHLKERWCSRCEDAAREIDKSR